MSRLVISLILTIWALGGCVTHSQKIMGNQVSLYLRATGNQEVFFASSLDGFQRHPLTRHAEKSWVISLPAGREFTYFYIMNNQPFIADCPYKEKDDFGSENCLFVPDP